MPTNLKILELWHISRTALGGVPGRYDRMVYVYRELGKLGYEKNKALWNKINELTQPYLGF